MKKHQINKGLKQLLFSLLALLLTLTAQAQTHVTGPLTGTNMLGEYYAYSNSSIVLNPGFSSVPTSGQSFHAYIVSADCQPLGLSPSFAQNFVLTLTPRTAFTAGPNYSTASTCDLMGNIQYLDGLGRPVQTIQVKGSPNANDLVQPQAYDVFGRESTKYQPYASPGIDGSFKTSALTEQGAFYSAGGGGIMPTAYPFAITNFELSNEGRPTAQGAPGTDWQTHTVTMAYEANGASDIRLWTVSGGGASSSGYYAYGSSTGTLTASVVTDENGHATISYKDSEGHVVCKKVQSGSSTYLATNYIYDDMGNLAYVIPPIPSGTTYPTSFSESDVVFTNFIYGYHYDGRHRVIEKKIPGKGWESMVYNDLDKVVATQDANQAGSTWTFTKYDPLGRVIQSGTWSGSSNRASLQSTVTSNTNLWETPASGGNGYTNNAWPTSGATTLTLNYYDNYSTSYIPGFPSGYSAPSGASTATTGLLTATKTAVLNNPGDMLWTVHYYDDMGRNIKTYAQHYLGGSGSLSTGNYDAVSNTYDFTNEVTATTRQHYVAGSLAVTIANTYAYDHVGRKTQTWEQINTGTNVLLSQTDYNEIGQAKTKHLHSTNSGSSFLQDENYTYNERGWLKTASAPLFAMQLNYNDGTTPQYNGNIANQYWGTPGSLSKSYTYSYDYLNRLTAGTASTGNSESGITYDELGNITALNRGGSGMGSLSYSYSGNQLTAVSGYTSRSYGYDANGNATSDGQGNSITYNMLNLPQSIPGKSLTYTYDAAGQKLRKVSGSNTTDYVNGIQYDNGSITFIQTEEGRVLNVSGTPNYEYTLADHLGNSRVNFDSSHGGSTATQVNDYYPFGLTIQPTTTSPANYYLYNKKELQPELTQYDYGARFYDPVIGRWTSVDPLAEISRRWSTYNYVMNNPIRLIDPDGMSSTDIYGRDKTDENGMFKLPDERGGINYDVVDDGGKKKTTTDAGHGANKDPGAVDGSDYESNYALEVEEATDSWLKAFGIDNSRTRSDENVDVKDRFTFRYNLANSNNSEVFVSFHLNGGTNSNNVYAIYQQGKTNEKESIRLGQLIVGELQSIMNSPSSVVPVKGHTRFSSLAVLQNFKGNAGVLIELGSINNKANRDNINKNYCQIGYNVATAIYRYIYNGNPKSTLKP